MNIHVCTNFVHKSNKGCRVELSLIRGLNGEFGNHLSVSQVINLSLIVITEPLNSV